MKGTENIFSLDSSRQKKMAEILNKATDMMSPILQNLDAPPYEIEHESNSTINDPVIRLRNTLSKIPEIQNPPSSESYPSSEIMARDIFWSLSEEDVIKIGDSVYTPINSFSEGEDVILRWKKN